MKHCRLLLICIIASWPHLGRAGLDDVKTDVGAGAEYQLDISGGEAQVSVYFAKNPGANKKAIEMYFNSKGFMGSIELWQRFHLSSSTGQSLRVTEGFLHSSMFETRKLDQEYLAGFDGVQMSQFLISSEADLAKHLVGKEKVTVPAGTVTAHHYRVERAGQVVDFWVHHESKPIGLVILESKGSSPQQNYKMKLSRLLSGVGEKIDPKKAKPMDEKTKAFLPKPGKGSAGLSFM